MITRPFAISDVKAIGDIYDKHHAESFFLPPPDRCITERVVTNDTGKIIAFGAVSLLAEAVLVLDMSSRLREKDYAIQQLLWQAIQGVSGKLDGLHAFVQDPEFARILKKHFGFKTCKGEALYLEV